MHMRRLARFVAPFALYALVAGCHAVKAGDTLEAAYQRKDWTAMLTLARREVAADPSSPRRLYNLACAEGLNRRAAETAATIDRLAAQATWLDLAHEHDLDGVSGDPSVKAALARLEAARHRVVGSAEVRFTLDADDLLVEGLAYDPSSGDFFVSSVHRRRILRLGSDGKPRDFVPPGEGGLYGVLGLRVDPVRKLLWATSSALPEVAGLGDGERGHTAVHCFDLDSGAVHGKIELFETGQRHHFDDLVLDGDGRAFVSDGFGGAIYAISPEGSHEVWLPAGTLASPQGLAWSADGQTLFAADYGRGLAAIDRRTRAVRWLRGDDATLSGLDGLLLDARDGSLVATQNGVQPPRVVRLRVDGDRVRSEILLMNAPRLTEPTLGAIVDGAFVFVANAQWDAFDPKHPTAAAPTVVMRLPLR
ncbi:MAG: SMP-30/gluconolactonase/LRE family protein [Myxococcales bacterium]|nr:SMP-30/gluconolactonase/LRE family protein [Myxococcales bacterium]